MRIPNLTLSFLLSLGLFFPTLLPAQIDTLWARRYNGPGNDQDEGYAIAVDGSGNVYVAGFSTGSGTDWDYATMKYNSSGQLQWVKRYEGPGQDKAVAMVIDDSGNVYVTGYVVNSGTGRDCMTIKYNSSGETQWEAIYNGPENSDDWCEGVAVDDSGNVYVTGCSNSQLLLIRYKSNGVQELVLRGLFGGSYALGHAVAVDDKGNIYLGGTRYTSFSHYDYLTAKFRPAFPYLRWNQFYNGPANGDDYLFGMAIDNEGNVYVTGRSDGVYRDYATIKYDSSGLIQWVKRYDGPANYRDEARAIAVDGGGNVYVTGGSYTTTTNFDLVTIKYASSGEEEWVVRYNGLSNDDDYGHAIALDESGNVYVTGYSTGSGTDWDYITIKYNSSGEEQWIERYDGIGHTDCAYAITLDINGNVYVTGYSTGFDGNFDYLTIKYGSRDVGVVAITAPIGVIDSSSSVTPACSVYNYGTTTADYTVKMKIGSPPFFTTTTSVSGHSPGTKLYVTFPTTTAHWPRGNHPVSCSTELVDDMNEGNNKKEGIVTVRVGGAIGTWQRLVIEVPMTPSHKRIKSGGLILNGGNKIYIVKGNNTRDFYYFIPENPLVQFDSVPILGKKGVKKGTGMVYDGTRWLYFASGTNTLQFWKYDTQGESGWVRLRDIPPGLIGKTLKGGTGMAYRNGVIYLLKGSKTNEFYGFNCATGEWVTLQSLPEGNYPGKGYGIGSCLVAYDENTLYALRGKYNEFYKYNILNNSWTRDSSMPLYHPMVNKKKKVGEGASMVIKDGKICAFKGGNTKEFWSFNPLTHIWAGLETIPKWPDGKYVKGGGGLCAWNDGTIYALKGNNTTSIWKYIGSVSSLANLSNTAPTENITWKRLAESGLRIFPNPTRGLTKIYYNLPKKEIATLKIYNTLGSLVYSAKSDKGEFEIKKLPAGIYLLQFESASVGYKEEKKLIVVK
ncbi:MAG: SBBP repeat-containing protein [candidate division WOR-3 bacterium]